MPTRLDTQDKLIKAMLPHVETLGWSDEALVAGAKSAKLKPELALTLFPEGEAQMVRHFVDWANRTMVKVLPAKEMAKLKVRQKVALVVRTRLELLADWKVPVGKAMAIEAKPWNAPHALKGLYETVDAIWRAAGDTATDFNFYTKRALLAGVYTTTLLFWLRDKSAGNEATWQFLDNRIENVMQFGKFTGKVKDKFKRAA